MPGLGASFGRGGATTAQQDLANADAILIMGSSMAENHPVGFQWVMEAKRRGAAVIHVDPRFTRTSAMADHWVPLRAGSDIVFLGGMIRWVLENGREFRDYVIPFTNAATILREDFLDTEDLNGLFSGWDAEGRKYSPETWMYEGVGGQPESDGSKSGGGGPEHSQNDAAGGGHGQDRGGEVQDFRGRSRDETLTDPRCVFQLLKRHFSRYTPEMVESACGVPAERFLQIAEAFASASGPDRTAAICYAVGWTQHSTGVQIIRAAAILQLLLGNIGRPGGGILALRGHASIQGSTDIPTLFDILPGYLPMPTFGEESESLDAYIERHKAPQGWWHNFDRYAVSLFKAWYGVNAVKENGFGFDWLPRLTGDHSHQGYWLEMARGAIEGLFVIGQNPAVGAPNSGLERRALAKLKWLVVRDLTEIETASFWYDSPEVRRGELSTRSIGTEVFLMPAAGHAEKDGTFTNTQRLLQWHEKAVEPPGDARSETWFIDQLAKRLREKAGRDPRPRNEGLNALLWDYPVDGPRSEPRAEWILREINGYRTDNGAHLEDFSKVQSDGTTACGCWIYSGVFPSPEENRARKREPEGRYGRGWGYAWPKDRRILYNRASARPDGAPWSERKKLVWWDTGEARWTGDDEPDFTKTKAPDYVPSGDAEGDAALRGDAPFLMHPDGVGWIWVPSGLKDGPLPAHYEPIESPVENAIYPERPDNPAARRLEGPGNVFARSPDARFPHVLSTWRLTEHHTAGGMTRTLPHLAELQPELFCEVSPELAREAGLEHGGWATIATARAVIEARVLVTPRARSLEIQGQTVHQVGLPYHWGSKGLVTGDAVNDLVALSEEPNVRIMESKAMTCRIEPGRRPRGRGVAEYLESLMAESP